MKFVKSSTEKLVDEIFWLSDLTDFELHFAFELFHFSDNRNFSFGHQSFDFISFGPVRDTEWASWLRDDLLLDALRIFYDNVKIVAHNYHLISDFNYKFLYQLFTVTFFSSRILNTVLFELLEQNKNSLALNLKWFYSVLGKWDG